MDTTNVDFLTTQGSQGELASYMASNGRMDPGQMRPYIGSDGRNYVTVYNGGNPQEPSSYRSVPIQTNATLRRDEWKQLDDVLLEIQRSRLGGVQDLVDNGLVYNLGNAMGTTVLEWHDVSDALSAELTMDGVTRAKGDRAVFGTNYLPIPIIHADYEINARVLEASRKLGNPLDTTMAERAGRRVQEKLENMLFTSTTYSFGGGTIYSYLNYPHRNEVSLTTAWNDSSIAATQIVNDVLTLKQASIDAKHYGPWMIYIPTDYETVLDEDYDTSGQSTQTIRERILKISGIKGIKVVDMLTADNVVMVQMTSDVVRLVRGMGLQNVEWQTEGRFIHKYKVLTIQVPQIRSDQDGNCGIVHLA